MFVEDIENPALAVNDRHHLSNVLRLKTGESLTVCDGEGSWRVCRFAEVIEPVGDVLVVPPPLSKITVGFSLIKGSRSELVVQKLTELGVDRIVPLVADRSVVFWDSQKAQNHFERFVRVSREAGMQSRRVHLPVLEPVSTFEEVAMSAEVVMAEAGGNPLSLDCSFVLIGPEGGWTENELGSRPRCSLGETVLRSETAAIAAGTLLTALRDKRVNALTAKSETE